MAKNIITYQINNDGGIPFGHGGSIQKGGWVKKVYSCWLPKTDDIQVNKYGQVSPTITANSEGKYIVNGISYDTFGQIPYSLRATQSQNEAAFGACKNGCTIGQMRFLSRIYKHTKMDEYKNSFMLGLNFIFNIYDMYGTFLYAPDTPGLMLPINDGHYSNVCLLLLDISSNRN